MTLFNDAGLYDFDDQLSDFPSLPESDEKKTPAGRKILFNDNPAQNYQPKKSILNFSALKGDDPKHEQPLHIQSSILKQDDTLNHNQSTAFGGFTIQSSTNLSPDLIPSDEGAFPDVPKVTNSKSLLFNSKPPMTTPKTKSSPMLGSKSNEIVRNQEDDNDNDIWETFNAIPLPSKNSPIKKSSVSTVGLKPQFMPNVNIESDPMEQEPFSFKPKTSLLKQVNNDSQETSSQQTEIVARKDALQSTEDNNQFSGSDASSQYQIKVPKSQTIEVNFATHFDNVRNDFMRLFLNEFKVLMRGAQNNDFVDIESFSNGLKKDVDDIVGFHKISDNSQIDKIGDIVTNTINEETKLIKAAIVETNNLKKTDLERQEIELKSLSKSVKRLASEYKVVASSTLLELSQEQKDLDIIHSANIDKSLSIQKQMQDAKIRRIELESKLNDTNIDLDETEKSIQKIDFMMQQRESEKTVESSATPPQLIDEIKSLLLDIQKISYTSPHEKLAKKIASLEKRVKLESQKTATLLFEMKAPIPEIELMKRKEKIVIDNDPSIITSTKKKLNSIKRKWNQNKEDNV